MKIRNYLLGACLALAALPAMAADIDGKWTANIESPMGAVTLFLEFKAEGEKLNGAIAIDMAGQQMPPTAISDGVVKGKDVSFKLSLATMEGAPPLVIVYTGKLNGDELAMNSVVNMDGNVQETPLVAKRAK
jgi:hypothetical protein